MTKTKDKQLRTTDLKEVMARRRLDLALNMKQFALAAGISYSAAQLWFRQPGFPHISGVVFWSDFVEWRRTRVGLKNNSIPVPTPDPATRYQSKYQEALAQGFSARAAHLLAEAASPQSQVTRRQFGSR